MLLLTGQNYWYNKQTKETSWTEPKEQRVEPSYDMNKASRALGILQLRVLIGGCASQVRGISRYVNPELYLADQMKLQNKQVKEWRATESTQRLRLLTPFSLALSVFQSLSQVFFRRLFRSRAELFELCGVYGKRPSRRVWDSGSP
jgi:hypothetical protein